MKTVTSISGGKSSAYIAANYPADHLVFSLVRTNDKSVAFKDKYVKQMVEDKLGREFVGTLEDDTIIYTMFDLEQYLGQEIDWVTGDLTFEELVTKRKFLPNLATRFCTTELKLVPIVHWWAEKFNREPVAMNIGYRANETNRAKTQLKKLNANGLSEFKATFSKHPSGRNKWEVVEWRKPLFPLVKDGVYKMDVENFWKDKPVRFAEFNNCVGCFHRGAAQLQYLLDAQPEKMAAFIRMEEQSKGFFKKEIKYSKIKDLQLTGNIFDKNSIGCDSGFCGM